MKKSLIVLLLAVVVVSPAWGWDNTSHCVSSQNSELRIMERGGYYKIEICRPYACGGGGCAYHWHNAYRINDFFGVAYKTKVKRLYRSKGEAMKAYESIKREQGVSDPPWKQVKP